jgi:hypothetical protein
MSFQSLSELRMHWLLILILCCHVNFSFASVEAFTNELMVHYNVKRPLLLVRHEEDVAREPGTGSPVPSSNYGTFSIYVLTLNLFSAWHYFHVSGQIW